MSNVAKFTFEPAYRQLDAVGRAFVDDFVTRVESVADRENRELFDVLRDWPSDMLSPRDIDQLKRPMVQAALFDRVQEVTESVNISPRKLLRRAASLALTSLNDFYDEETDSFSFKRGTVEQRAAIKKIKETENVRSGEIKREYELMTDNAMLRTLMQQQGMLNPEGEPINPERWSSAGLISTSHSVQDAEKAYVEVMNA